MTNTLVLSSRFWRRRRPPASAGAAWVRHLQRTPSTPGLGTTPPTEVSNILPAGCQKISCLHLTTRRQHLGLPGGRRRRHGKKQRQNTFWFCQGTASSTPFDPEARFVLACALRVAERREPRPCCSKVLSRCSPAQLPLCEWCFEAAKEGFVKGGRH